MAGVPADTQGSTALKSLATERTSNCILQSANLLQLLRNSSHSEATPFLPHPVRFRFRSGIFTKPLSLEWNCNFLCVSSPLWIVVGFPGGLLG